MKTLIDRDCHEISGGAPPAIVAGAACILGGAAGGGAYLLDKVFGDSEGSVGAFGVATAAGCVAANMNLLAAAGVTLTAAIGTGYLDNTGNGGGGGYGSPGDGTVPGDAFAGCNAGGQAIIGGDSFREMYGRL